MHLRQGKEHIGLCIAAELNKLLHSCGVTQVGKTPGSELTPCFNTWGLIKVIIGTKIVFIQQQVYLFTALAAEVFILCANDFIAGIATMITIWSYIAFCYNNDTFFFKN